MILNGFQFGMERGLGQRRHGTRRPMPQQRGLPAFAAAPQPSSADPAYVAQLEATVRQLQSRLVALGGVVTQLQSRLFAASQRLGAMPAAKQVVEVKQNMGAAEDECASQETSMAPSATDRAWYGEHLKGSDLADFTGSDFGDLDSELGLDG